MSPQLKRHIISALVTALSAVLASLSLLILNIDWSNIANAQEAFVTLSGVLMVALRA